MICGECGGRVPDGSSFCNECGAALVSNKGEASQRAGGTRTRPRNTASSAPTTGESGGRAPTPSLVAYGPAVAIGGVVLLVVSLFLDWVTISTRTGTAGASALDVMGATMLIVLPIVIFAVLIGIGTWGSGGDVLIGIVGLVGLGIVSLSPESLLNGVSGTESQFISGNGHLMGIAAFFVLFASGIRSSLYDESRR